MQGLCSDLENLIARQKRRKTPNEALIKTLEKDLEKYENGVLNPASDRYMALIYPEMATAMDYIPADATVVVLDQGNLKRTARSRTEELGMQLDSLLQGGILAGELCDYVSQWEDFCRNLRGKTTVGEHCTIGLVVTTDGSITDISRQDYIAAERRAIQDMQATGKPFLVIINSRHPQGENALALQQQLQENYGIHAHIADCQAMSTEDILAMLRQLLFSFPLGQIRLYLPRWLNALEEDDPTKTALYQALLDSAGQIRSLQQVQQALMGLEALDMVEQVVIRSIDLGTGSVDCAITLQEGLFYEILSRKAGMEIQNDAQLVQLLTELAAIRKEYEKVADALSAVKATGYGVVMPSLEEMTLQSPQMLHKGSAYGVKLKAGAPSIHMMRVDIDTEISPMVGSEKQSADLITYLGGEDSEKLWQSNIFGKSVYDLVQEGISAKLLQLPEEVRDKFRITLQRIVNEGAQGLVCLIL